MKTLNQTFLKTLMISARLPEVQHEAFIEAIQMVIDEEVTQARYDMVLKEETKRFIPTLISLNK